MKRILLLLLVLVLLLAAPGMALSLTFQDASEFGAYMSCSSGTCYWQQSANGGNSYLYASTFGGVINTDPQQFTYAAFTDLGSTNGACIGLKDSGGAALYSICSLNTGSTNRFEIKMVGGQAHIYRDNKLVAVSGVLAQNPSYLVYGNGYSPGDIKFDDFVLGTTENRYIFGSPEQGYFLKKDMINPAASGFCFPNGTIISNYNMTTTWGFGDSNASQTVQLKDYAGNVYWTYDTTPGTMAGTISWPLQEAIFNSGAPYGYYVTTIAGSGEYSEVIPYFGYGATVGFDKDSYSRGDTAIVSYSVDAGYWDTATYAYRLDTMTVFGTVVDTQAVTSQTGSKSVTFTSDDALGVYYAVLIRTPTAGGDDAWLWADSAELTGYLVFTGNVYDAETALPIPVANVSIGQGSTWYNHTTAVDGNYTTNAALYSGTTTYFNITASGYQQYYATFTPLEAKTVVLNFTLQNLTPSHNGLAVGGVVRDSVYGRPIALPTVTATNATFAESYSVTGNSVGYYQIDEDDGVFLTVGRCYTITGSKTGYGSQSYLKCVVSS